MFGALSDNVRRKPIMIGAYVFYLSLACPLFAWVHQSPSISHLLLMQVVLCTLHGAFCGPFSTALAEQFPARIRSTALGITYKLALPIERLVLCFLTTNSSIVSS
jgi:MHS family proline/betaine transporter-like MFS transporter